MALNRLWHWLRFEPEPVRPYIHPSQYRAPENVRLYSDGMHKLYEPSLITLAIATVTLGLYIGIPHILLGLLAFSWYRPAGIALLLLLGTLLLPAKPLRVKSVLSSYVFLCWRRYFKFSYLFEKSLDCYQDYIIAQFPHGAFPLGALLGGTFMATEYPEYYCYAMAASSAFYVPIWRHVHAWLGTETCTKNNFHGLLSLGVKGPLHKRRSTSGSAQPEMSSVAESEGPAAAAAGKAQGSPFAAATDAAGLAAEGLSLKPSMQLGSRRGSELPPVGSRRLSLTASLTARFRHHHSLSDTESSDSDSEPCSCSSSPMRTGQRRLSNSSDSSGSSGSSCTCGSSCSACSPLGQLQTHSSMPARLAGGGSKLRSSSKAKPGQVAQTEPMAQQQQQQANGSGSDWRIDPATGKRKTGVSVGLMVGGIAEMFMIRQDRERIKLRDRKGFVRIALEHGVPILPVYMFGANQVLDFGPPWLQRLSRKVRASVGMIYGAWGLPVPRRIPIFMVTGTPLAVGPAMRKDHPDFQKRVDEVHAQFIGEMERIYYTHRAKYGHGYENRPLVIC